jgi:serine/threonine protein kinase
MEYAAPEFFQRDEGGLIGYSQAVDLWSLGATLCELITHTIPRSLTRTERDNGDDGYSLQALGLESGNISKTLGQFACPDCIIDVVMEVRCFIFLA